MAMAMAMAMAMGFILFMNNAKLTYAKIYPHAFQLFEFDKNKFFVNE